MEWIFVTFLVVSLLHMGEEFVYPGGFMETIKHLNPRLAQFVTKPMAVLLNGLQLLLCIAAILAGKTALVFSMSVAGLLFINGLIHIGACIKAKGYAPGVITGVLLYLPLSTYSYYHFTRSSQLLANEVVITGMLGLLYQAVPMSYFMLASTIKHPK
jgi:hypothetical protein